MSIQIKSMLVLVITITFFALPSYLFAGEKSSSEAKIARAMEAAPAFIAETATIIDTDGSVLRKGTNGWTCMPAMSGGAHPMCNDEVWMRFLNAVGNKADFKTETIGFSYMLAGDDNVNNADPYDIEADAGEVWVQEGPHLMILVPNLDSLAGLSDDPDNGGPYVMWKGTPYVHVMVPVDLREK